MKIAGLQIKIERSAGYAFVVMALVVMGITVLIGTANGELRAWSPFEVVFVGLATASFHFFAQLMHLTGHALAAWAVGYPKSGMWFLYVFAMSLYPPDEPPLPARTHIQRSLGGVAGFALVLIFALVVWLAARDASQWWLRYLTGFMLLEAVFLFIFSAVFADGVLFIVQKRWQTPPPNDNVPL